MKAFFTYCYLCQMQILMLCTEGSFPAWRVYDRKRHLFLLLYLCLHCSVGIEKLTYRVDIHHLTKDTVNLCSPKGAFLLHWASGPPLTRRPRRTSYPKNGVKKRRQVRLGRSLGRPTVCLPETKRVRHPTHQQIKWSST